MVELRLNAVAPADKFQLGKIAKDTGAEKARTGTRKAYWGPEHGFRDTPIYQRESLGAGVEIAGPALFEAEDTVIVTPPDWRFRTDEWGVGWIETT